MKRLHWFVVKSFIGPFLVTFTIAMFFLIMQFLWKYIDDLMGKGLELSIILEMLFYVSASLIPMALPLAVLFSSIMTFGNLSEKNELTALKSAGISLLKVMRPMLIFVIFLSIAGFYFSNYILPISNLKWRTIYYDILEKKPAFQLKEGIFYKDIENYHIKVDKKNDDGSLTGVLIYDFTSTFNRRVIKARNGMMLKSDNDDYLFLQLNQGVIYEKVTASRLEKVTIDFQKSFFTDAVIKFDLVGFDLQKSDEELFKQEFEMMNFVQLDNALDSLIILNDSLDYKFAQNLKTNFVVLDDRLNHPAVPADSSLQDMKLTPLTQIDTLVHLDSLKGSTLKSSLADAQSEFRTVKDQLYHQTLLKEHRDTNMNEYRTAWHGKFTLSFAVLVLFFIGAPLGAIIRKGGLGAPLVFATKFFIFYYMLTVAGENMVESEVIEPWKGIWMSTILLAPIGAFLTYKAANDSPLFDKEVYKKWFTRIFRRKQK